MKKNYTEPVMEIYLFENQDQIKASSVPDNTKKKMAEDEFADANGIAEGFFWY